jgi:hypothetical protein
VGGEAGGVRGRERGRGGGEADGEGGEEGKPLTGRALLRLATAEYPPAPWPSLRLLQRGASCGGRNAHVPRPGLTPLAVESNEARAAPLCLTNTRHGHMPLYSAGRVAAPGGGACRPASREPVLARLEAAGAAGRVAAPRGGGLCDAGSLSD